jgi:hypothetical protein
MEFLREAGHTFEPIPSDLQEHWRQETTDDQEGRGAYCTLGSVTCLLVNPCS